MKTAIPNPFDGIIPDFSVFGGEFTELWQKLLAGAWALGIIASAIIFIFAVIAMGKATLSENPQAHASAARRALVSGIVVGVLAAIAVIFGAILAFFS